MPHMRQASRDDHLAIAAGPGTGLAVSAGRSQTMSSRSGAPTEVPPSTAERRDLGAGGTMTSTPSSPGRAEQARSQSPAAGLAKITTRSTRAVSSRQRARVTAWPLSARRRPFPSLSRMCESRCAGDRCVARDRRGRGTRVRRVGRARRAALRLAPRAGAARRGRAPRRRARRRRGRPRRPRRGARHGRGGRRRARRHRRARQQRRGHRSAPDHRRPPTRSGSAHGATRWA